MHFQALCEALSMTLDPRDTSGNRPLNDQHLTHQEAEAHGGKLPLTHSGLHCAERSEMLLNTLKHMPLPAPPTRRNYPAWNASGAQDEKPWSNEWHWLTKSESREKLWGDHDF